jgi:four helix bundle protein
MAPYERFEALQLCHQLALAIYRETATFPRQEQYGLTAQARRAAFSAPANIVEGSVKRGAREFPPFLDIALGSLAELGYAIRFAHELGFLNDARTDSLLDARARASKATWTLYASMGRK